jgi:carbonic anhydrase
MSRTAASLIAAWLVAAAAQAAEPRHGLPHEAPDPMEMLREKLAARLKAASAAASAPGNELHLATRSEPPAAAVAPRRAAAPKAAPKARDKLPEHWSYEGAGGPANWGALKPEYGTCASGERQSPIDFRETFRVDMEPIQFDYRANAFRVVDNGHTVQVNLAAGSSIEVQGRRYELVQFHFHRPSEETIDGKRYEMSLHLVHRDPTGRLAVVGLLIEGGQPQPVVAQVWANLPLERGDEIPARSPLDLNALLPADRGYFATMGSLTTPPCTEGVLWMVMKQPVQLAPEQIGIFARLYPMNARPLQRTAGRMIKESP